MSKVRIVFPKRDGASPSFSNGTKVFVGDKEVDGVVRIDLVFEVNEPVRGVIQCLAEVDGEVVVAPLDFDSIEYSGE